MAVGAVDPAGKVALITGAAAGMGAAAARRLAELGATVVGADIQDEAGEALFAELGEPHRYRRLDVGDETGWQRVIEETVADLGRLEILFLNAGIISRSGGPSLTADPLGSLTEEALRRVSRVNVDGVVLGTIAALPSLRAAGAGAIVITSSLAGIRPVADPLYTLTKHAVVGFGRALGPLLEADGVSVNVLCPGSILTSLAPPEEQRQPGSVYSPASYIADCVVHILASGETGQVWLGLQEPDPPFRVGFSEFVTGGTGAWAVAADQLALQSASGSTR